MRQDIITKISKIRHQIVLNSIIYYKLDTNVISDAEYDQLCIDEITFKKQFPKEAEAAMFANEFRDFEGFSGYHLCIPEYYKEAHDLATEAGVL